VSTHLDWEWDEEPMKELEARLEGLRYDLFEIVHESADIDTPSGLPYCGCDVCETREMLAVVMPAVLDMLEAGQIRRAGS
jgi:hypothetical protein